VVLLLTAALAILVPAGYLHFAWLSVILLTVIVLMVAFGDLLLGLLVWLLSTACFSYFFWRLHLPYFFNPTIDRLLMPLLIVIALGMMVAGRLHWRRLWPVSAIMAAMLAYFTVSMALTGLESQAAASPHFRLIGGYYFPFIALVLAFLAAGDEQQLRKAAIFFYLFGVYLAVTAWAERFGIWWLVYPKYILNPELGTHWGRSRGPFMASPPLGLTLVYVFYSNFYLAKRAAAPLRTIILATQPVVLGAIFFTQTRSVWLAAIVCAVIWVLGTRRKRSRAAAMAVLAVAAGLVAVVFWGNILSRQREKGGVADPIPVYARVGLAKMTYRIFTEYPLTGVGFGHFREHATKYYSDPASKYLKFGAAAPEHNNILSLLAECGLPGAALYVWLLVILFRRSLRLYRRLSATGTGYLTRDFVVLYWVLFADYVIDGMFRETSVDPFNNGLFFVISGLVLGLDYMLHWQQTSPWPSQTPQTGTSRRSAFPAT